MNLTVRTVSEEDRGLDRSKIESSVFTFIYCNLISEKILLLQYDP